MSKRFALLVGMTAYPDDRLVATATSKEIRTLVEQLRDPENGRFDRVVPLLNQTALDLQLGIASFFEQAMEPGDLVLIYFAGHSLIHHQNIYLATKDTFTEEYLDATTVEIDFVRRRLNASPAQQILLLDCDFSFIGATDRHTDGFGMLSAALQADNRAVLVAPQLTGSLVDGLQGAADADANGTITFAELSGYVQQQLPESEPPTIATNENLDGLSLAFCAAVKTAAPVAPPVPIVTPETPSPSAESARPPSNRRRNGIIVLVLLLFLLAFGFYAVSSGMFAGDDAAVSQPISTTVPAIVPNASETPSLTPTKEAEETAVATSSPVPTKTVAATESATATISATATPTITPTATISPTATTSPTATVSPTPTETPEPTVTTEPTPTPEPTATSSPTPGPTSEPVPMEIVAQQAFLRAGPGINYRILDFPSRGTAVTVIARDSAATWYNVILEDATRGWLHKDVLTTDDEDAFDGISVAATIPAPSDDFYDPVLTSSGDSLSLQVYHTYVGTRGDNATLQARLLPETDLIQPTYLNGQELGLGLLIVAFNRVTDGDYTSNQVELCMVAQNDTPFYCETFPAQKSW